MDDNNLSKFIGDIILERISGLSKPPRKDEMVTFGDTYIIRSYGAGVFCGKLIGYDAESRIVRLDDCIRIHYWDKAASLSQLSKEGEKNPKSARFSVETDGHIVLQVTEIIPVTKVAKENLYAVPKWKM